MDEVVLSERAEEALAGIWLTGEETGAQEPTSCQPAGHPDEAKTVAELAKAGLVERRGGAVWLTNSGRAEAASIIRRERLAERMLTDVLELGEQEVAETACKFEHLLRRGIDDEICTLLGHPRFCPHGSPIPAGECCRAPARSPEKVISALADLSPGQSGVVAYIHGRRRELMQRMLSMGVIPGTPITLVQTSPSYVFQLGEAQVAVDRETAQDIYVRVATRRQPDVRRAGWLRGPIHRLGLRRGHGRR